MIDVRRKVARFVYLSHDFIAVVAEPADLWAGSRTEVEEYSASPRANKFGSEILRM